jgi:hypothetical protein
MVRRLVLAGHVADSADTQAILCFWFLDGYAIPPNGHYPLFAYGREAIYRLSTRRMVKCFGIFRMGPNHKPSGKMLEPTPLNQITVEFDSRLPGGRGSLLFGPLNA